MLIVDDIGYLVLTITGEELAGRSMQMGRIW